MKRITTAVALALVGLVGASTPATAFPTNWSGGTCTTTKYRTEHAAGWNTVLVKVRRVTVCRNTAGEVTGVRVTVRSFRIPA